MLHLYFEDLFALAVPPYQQINNPVPSFFAVESRISVVVAAYREIKSLS